MDSGPSIGLLQVSPAGRSKELSLVSCSVEESSLKITLTVFRSASQFKNHAKVSANTHTWDNSNLEEELIDWRTGEQLQLSSLDFSE